MKKYIFLFILLFASSVFALNATVNTTPEVATVYEDFLVNFTLNETQDVKEINISIPNGLSFTDGNNTNTTADFYEDGSNLTWNSSSTLLEAGIDGWFSANFSTSTSGNYTFNISTYNDTSLIDTKTYDITVYENEISMSPTSYYITEEFVGNFTVSPTQDVYKINVTFDADFEIDNTTYGATSSNYDFLNSSTSMFFYNGTNSILNATDQGSFWINLTGLAEGTYNFTVSLYNSSDTVFNTTNVSFTVEYRTLDFYGYTKDTSGDDLSSTNVTLDIYELTESGPSFVRSVSELSDPFFNLSIPINQSWLYQPVLNKNNNYVGQTLPMLPYSEFSSVSNVTFYLREAESIFINMTNQTDPINFTYILKDKETGFVVDESVLQDVKNVTFYVPKERDYSLLVIPNETTGFPITYTIDDLSSSVEKEFNSSTGNVWINGTVELNDSSTITNLTIIPYLMESGDMVMFDNSFPLNMTGEDVYSGGTYNITLPTLSENMTLLLFANAYNDSEYFGAFETITLNETGVQGNITDFNFTAYPLVGETKNISTYLGSSEYNVTTKLINFTLQGMKDGSLQRPNTATVEMELNYSLLNNSYFKWSTHLSQTDNGTFVLPALNYSVEDFTIFTQDFAPYRTSMESSDLNDTMTINLTTFDNAIADPDSGSVFSDITISLFRSNSTCDAPGNSCDSLLSADISSFNPLSAIMVVVM